MKLAFLPSWRLDPITLNSHTYYTLRSIAVGSAIFFAAVFFPHCSFCIFKSIFHVPCPACGATRSTLAAMHLSTLDSFLWSPGLWLAMIAFTAGLYFYHKKPNCIKNSSRAALCAFLLTGFFRIVIYLFFPCSTPLHLAF